MKIPIHYKITLVFGIIVAITLFGIYLYINKSLKEHNYLRTKANLIKKTSLAKTLIEKNYSENKSRKELDEIADKIGTDLDLRVTIIDVDGTVLGDSELDDKRLFEIENHLYRQEVQMAIQSGIGESKRFSTTIKKDMLYIASTYGKGKTQGIIRLAMPLFEIELISNRLKKVLWISVFIAFIMAIIISFLASIFISKPIREVSKISRDFARGDFEKRVAVTSDDEIGDLAVAFNYMAEQIKVRIQEVMISRSRLEAVLLSMFEGVMVVDMDGTILLMNHALKNFLQIKKEAVGKKLLEVVRNIEIHQIVDKTLQRKQGVQTHEISLLLPEEKIALIHATQVSREGKPEGVVLVFHDITELRRFERMRQDFVANVSHELRTPVTSIKGYAETLIEGALEDKENAHDFLKIIFSDANRLAKLIDDLLDLSKIESGKLKINLRPFTLKPLIEGVVSDLNSQLQDRSIKVNIDIPENLSGVSGDETAIAQVLFNLIENAIKYNNDGGRITISGEDKGEFVEVSISDTGIGIPQDDLPRIFERFYRVDKSRDRELGGTGLGLSIVKHIVQAHNGEVFARSDPGKGSTFYFTIPKS
ncbi:MAG: ATP-binding protein [Thermodesulfobacteriota bacterium]|nr:ATP-binding protein [Thermodesulfobacteriota bacterium]